MLMVKPNFFLLLLSSFPFAACNRYSDRRTTGCRNCYDFVVVGAGTAGPIVARRLADAGHTVLLLDRGSDPGSLPNLPDLPFNKVKVPLFTWDLLESPIAEPSFSDQEIPLAMRRTLPVVGRSLGGQANFNNFIYNRGNKDKYDRWNLPEFTFDKLLRYFKKSENSLSHDDDKQYHGVGGLLPVEEQTYKSPDAKAFIEAAILSGFSLNNDTNRGDSDGISWIQSHSSRGLRVSMYDAFVAARGTVDDRLTVKHSAQATRIVFQKKKNGLPRARKVEYIHEGKPAFVAVKKEVIVSAGALHSPQLLMLSGVGKRTDLEDLGIDVVANNPEVGEGLADRVAVPLLYASNETIDAQDPIMIVNPEQITNFLTNNPEESVWAQPIGSTLLVNSTGKYAAEYASLMPRTMASSGIPLPMFAIGIGCVISDHSDSGRVYLRSKDPFAPIGFTTNILQSLESIESAVQCLKDMRGVASKMPPYIVNPAEQEHIPSYLVSTDGDLAVYARAFSRSAYSLQGSMKLNTALRLDFSVKGVKGVRVVDASVFPKLLDANMVAPIMAMAEKLAAKLVKKYK